MARLTDDSAPVGGVFVYRHTRPLVPLRTRRFSAVLCGIVSALLLAGVSSSQERQEAAQPPLSLVLLVDASGSMKRTDPDSLRKAAAQAVVTMLSDADRVAVVEFGQEARTFGTGKDVWLSPRADQEELFARIARTGKEDWYTDFYEGLSEAARVMASAPGSSRKVVLLLSDGEFEPNPHLGAYQNTHRDFRRVVAGRRLNYRDEYGIYAPLLRRFVSEARGLLDREVFPLLVQEGVEVFTVGLSEEADRQVLEQIADRTSRNQTEVHSFYAQEATDLLGVFSGLLRYWGNMMILHQDEHVVNEAGLRNVYLDTFVHDPLVLALVAGAPDFVISGPDGREMPVAGTHDLLRIYRLAKGQPPGEWSYGITQPGGAYRTFWVARSLIKLRVDGLQPSYDYGQNVTAKVLLDGIRHTDLRDAAVEVTLTSPDGAKRTDNLRMQGGECTLGYEQLPAGNYRLDLVLSAKDRSGSLLLPRPSVQYRFEVMPAFYVTPRTLSFGHSNGGKTVSRTVTVHYGLEAASEVRVSGRTTGSGNRLWHEGALGDLPAVKEASFHAEPGQSYEMAVELELPRNSWWRAGGEYEGELVFHSASGEAYTVTFRTRIHTWWDTARWFVLAAIIAGVLILAYFIYIWAVLPKPAGVLVPIGTPGGEQLQRVILSGVKGGFFSSWISPKRNCVSIATRRADICYRNLPQGMRVEFAFYRWPGTFVCYLRNRSIRVNTMAIMAGDPKLMLHRIRPGVSFRLKHGSVLEFGGYKFRFESAR